MPLIKANLIARASLKTRLILASTGLMVVFVWGLAILVATGLQGEVEQLLSEQQDGMARRAAESIDHKLMDGIAGLNGIATQLPADIGYDSLRSYISRLPLLQILFSGGIAVLDLQGNVMADYPELPGRRNANYAGRDYFRQVVATGQPYIGQPTMGRLLNRPILVIGVPVRDAFGNLRAVLAGVIDLTQPNVFGYLFKRSTEEQNEFFIISLRDQMIVAATDRQRTMVALPGRGSNSFLDRVRDGFEGSDIAVSSTRVRKLYSARRIASADWVAAIALPTETAFAPLRRMQAYILGAAALLTLFGGWLSYRLVGGLLMPLAAANQALRRMSGGGIPLAALPVGRADEIGQLVDSFNQLVADRQDYEARLQQLSMVVEQSPASILITDLSGRIEYVNEAFVRSTGYSPAEAVGQNARLLKSGQTPGEVYKQLWQALQAGRNWQGEMINRRKNGEIFCEMTLFAPIRQADGSIFRYLAIKEDVTEKRKLEMELDQHRFRLEQLVAARTAELEQANRQLRISDARLQATLELTQKGSELSEADLLRVCIDAGVRLTESGVGYLHFVTEDQLDFCQTSWSTGTRAVFAATDEAPYPVSKAGLWAEVVQAAMPLVHNDEAALSQSAAGPQTGIFLTRHLGVQVIEEGRVCLVLGVGNKLDDYDAADIMTLQKLGHDLWRIVTRRRAENALRAAKLAAEAAARAKMDFLANMSHEIRTPMNAVLGLARIGVRENRGRKTCLTSTRILDASRHLLGVINDILDFSKIDAGKLSTESAPFSLRQIIQDAVSLVVEKASDKSLALHVELQGDVASWVVGDALRLRQILVNLLSNGVKFTERGEVRLAVSRQGEQYHFCVSDTGIGMSAAEIGRLFDPFEQADASTTRKYGGTGLGLAISDQLARLMGGHISVDSQPECGSTFCLHLDLPETGRVQEPERPVDTVDLQGVRVLAVEDIEVNRIILDDLLLHAGMQVTFAENGQQALDRVQECGPAAFDVVLMDVQMPVMDGLEATRRLQVLAPSLPVIGLTAHAFAEERDRCLAAGMVAHVSKPVDFHVLCATIRQHLLGDPMEKPRAPAARDPEIVLATRCSDRSSSVIDWPGLLQRFGDRHDFVVRLARSMCEQHKSTPDKLRAASAQGDADVLLFLGHSLKGVGGNLCAEPLQHLAAGIEAAAATGGETLQHQASRLADVLEALLGECACFISES